MTYVSNHLVEGFLKSWGMILVSEIGDKTFFIAAVMAMKNSRALVFLGAIGALALMTVLSAFLGWAAPNLISKTYTQYAATALFFCFGLRMLWEALFASEKEGESELEEVERELRGGLGKKGSSTADLKNGTTGAGKAKGLGGFKQLLTAVMPVVVVETFVLTFLAEWGDRSQIATIGLAASTDVFGVTLGGIVGHALCTGAAVLGGRHLAAHINEQTLTIVGGLLFLAFGVHSLMEALTGSE